MKAIQISDYRKMAVVEVEEPQMKSNEVLLRLQYVGFCGSDLSTYLGKNPMVKMPVIPGHEVGAVIEKVGADVPEGLKPGMVVTVNPYTNCGKCASCRNGRVNACQHNETLSATQWSHAHHDSVALGEGDSGRTTHATHVRTHRAYECGLPCREPRTGD